MFTGKPNINTLTSLLHLHGIRHAVVCPGSRNAPLVHNLQAAGMECFPVTDERSAGFIAIGIAQETSLPVVVCVTSGTAVSNLLPAVTEAYYQHIPLIVVSADRPEAWINQLDGQTINQLDALRSVVKKVVNLPEPHDETSHWHCNRLVNEALIACRHCGGAPVQINVPISEPLYNFTSEALPTERMINHIVPSAVPQLDFCLESLAKAHRPLVIIGQTNHSADWAEATKHLHENGYIVLSECLANAPTALHNIDEMLAVFSHNNTDHTPDFILYAGDTLISKKLKQWLRSLKNVPMWRVSIHEELADLTTTMTGWVQTDAINYLKVAQKSCATDSWVSLWKSTYSKILSKTIVFRTQNHSFQAVKTMLSHAKNYAFGCRYSSANSLAVRYMNILCSDYVVCNRGTNGIEGSLSVAVGMSLATQKRVFHVTGDLSFFYDQNALWQQQLGGNLRILLLNNGGGGIFSKFEGLRTSAARERLVMAEHSTQAEGICKAYDVDYRQASTLAEIEDGTLWLAQAESRRPMLLEVMSDKEEDMNVLRGYMQSMI